MAAPGTAASEASPAYEAVRATFAGLAGGDDFESAWNLTLRDGFLASSAFKASGASFRAGSIAESGR